MTAPRDNALQNNPLLTPSSLPYGAPPLDQLKPEYFIPAVKIAVAAAEKEIAAIKNNPAAPSFENTIEALEFSGSTYSRILKMFGLVSSTKSNETVRKIEKEIDPISTKYSNDLMLDSALFGRIKTVYDQRDKLKLTGEQSMLLTETYKSFVRSGALLNAADKLEMRAINEKLSEISITYGNNTLESTDAYQKSIDDESELAGLPERAKNILKNAAEKVRKNGPEMRKEAEEAKAAAALPGATKKTKEEAVEAEENAVKAEKKAAGATGKWLIKLSPPPTDILEYCENRALREEIFRARENIACNGAFDNHPVVLEIVRLRQRQAEIMGFPNFAAFKLDDTMAKTPEAVMDLLEKNASVYKPAAEKFLRQVEDYARKDDASITSLKPWDYFYYSRKLKEETFKQDMEELRPYFDIEKVLDGLRIHSEKLFNISITETKVKYPVYDPDVKVYEVKDKKTGDMIGLFYGDYYARAGEKQSGAWMDTLRKRGIEDGENKFSIVQNVCNFPKPAKGHPALLSLDEVRTAFHEFGHGLHALLAEGNYTSLTCTSVKHDFVEVMSQLLENWAKEKEVLDTFAIHHKTGERLSPALIKKINDMENFDAAYQGLRQTFFGLLDMKWHTTDPATIKSAEALEDGVAAKASLFPREVAPMSVRFGHLFGGGYAAGYYGYKWAEVLEADIFTLFQKNGLYDRASADRLRNPLYSKGGAVDPGELFFAVMGREPDPNALFRREGLLPPEDKKLPKTATPRPPKR